ANGAELRYTAPITDQVDRAITLLGPGAATFNVPNGGGLLLLTGTVAETGGVTALVKTGPGQFGFQSINHTFTGGGFIREGIMGGDKLADSGTASSFGSAGSITLGNGTSNGT